MSKTKKLPLNIEYGKIPPSAIDLEEAVLGALMLEKTALKKIINILEPGSFYKKAHNKIYQAILYLSHNNAPIDQLTVTEQLRKTDELEIVGGPYYVSQLTGKVASAAHIEYHARIIAQKYVQRELIRITSEVQIMAFDNQEDPKDIIDFIQAELDKFDYYIENLSRKELTVDNALTEINKEIEEVDKGIRKDTLSCGMTKIDETIRFASNETILIGGPKKCGKSKLIRMLIYWFFRNNDNFACQIRSMEDPTKDVIRDFKSITSNLSIEQQKQLKGYTLSPEDRSLLRDADTYLKSLNSSLSIINKKDTIRSIGKEFNEFCMKNTGKICMLVIDNLSLTNDIRQRDKGKSIYEAQVDAANEIENLKGEGRIIVVIHHIKTTGQQCLANGYRMITDDLVFHERLSAIITQVILLNNTEKHTNLVTEESIKPDIKVDDKHVSRSNLINNILIAEKTEDRNGKNEEEESVIRFYPADLGTLKFPEWSPKKITTSYKRTEDDKDRNIHEVKIEQFTDELYCLNEEGDPYLTLRDLNFALRTKKCRYTDKKVTFDFIIRKYSQYFEVKLSKQNDKFTRKEDRIRTIKEWLNDEMWNENFVIHEKRNKEREHYLYGIKL